MFIEGRTAPTRAELTTGSRVRTTKRTAGPTFADVDVSNRSTDSERAVKGGGIDG